MPYVLCPQCSSQRPSEDAYCARCGASLQGARPDVRAAAPEADADRALAEQAALDELARLYHLLLSSPRSRIDDLLAQYGPRIQQLEEQLGPEKTAQVQRRTSTFSHLIDNLWF